MSDLFMKRRQIHTQTISQSDKQQPMPFRRVHVQEYNQTFAGWDWSAEVIFAKHPQIAALWVKSQNELILNPESFATFAKKKKKVS